MANFHSPTAVSWPKIIQPERFLKLICNLWLYTLIPRAISQPKIIGPERNVNLICNSSLYTHIPKFKSISPSIAKTKWWQLNIWPNFKGHNSAKNHWTGTKRTLDLLLIIIHPHTKSISQSIAKISGDNCFISELRNDGHG